jgi:hypothetical protein
MSIIDTNLVIDWQGAITVSRVSANILDMQSIRNVAKGQPVYLNIYVDTAFTTDTDTLAILLISSSGATPGATDFVTAGGTIMTARAASALLSTGYIYKGALPENIPYERVGLYYTVNAAIAAGYVSAFLTIGQTAEAVVLT